MATRANAAVNVCDGTRLRPENIQAAYAGSEENREPLSLTTVEQDASTSWNRRDGKCLLSGSLPGEPKGYFRETPVRHSSANLAGASFSPRFAPAIFVPGERPSLALTAYRRGFRLSLVSYRLSAPSRHDRFSPVEDVWQRRGSLPYAARRYRPYHDGGRQSGAGALVS